jgi:hypothetical protein
MYKHYTSDALLRRPTERAQIIKNSGLCREKEKTGNTRGKTENGRIHLPLWIL